LDGNFLPSTVLSFSIDDSLLLLNRNHLTVVGDLHISAGIRITSSSSIPEARFNLTHVSREQFIQALSKVLHFLIRALKPRVQQGWRAERHLYLLHSKCPWGNCLMVHPHQQLAHFWDKQLSRLLRKKTELEDLSAEDGRLPSPNKSPFKTLTCPWKGRQDDKRRWPDKLPLLRSRSPRKVRLSHLRPNALQSQTTQRSPDVPLVNSTQSSETYSSQSLSRRWVSTSQKN
jgi:hypothetical protein